ncbi:protein artemis-like [Hetaerina americana]|uniref:protein artemis-like n=1 Tax=Hetaerina americana TaxID=62018 RepID=UPI003A7F3CBB
MSIFNGKLDEIPEITIDRFDGEKNLKESTAYFLTHFHSDHMKGLDTLVFRQALLERNDVYLYTSEITRCIMKNHSRYHLLIPKIKPLPSVGCKLLSIPSLIDDSSHRDLQVTLIPTGHCPGSVMFFFELQQGNILYTGDFRLSRDNICTLSDLHHKDGTPKEINALYVDATYFDDLYPIFPKREESVEKIFNLTKDWLEKCPHNEVLLDTAANYGYEYIFGELRKKLGMKVHVSRDKVNTLRNVKEINAAITHDRRETRIHACAYQRTLPSECRGLGDKKFLTLRLSCMWYEKNYAAKGVIAEDMYEYTRVCYSSHCSKEELVNFIEYFLPKKVVACAIPRGRTANEVENEIMDLIHQKSKTSTDSSSTPEDSHTSYALKCQVKRKMMSSPRKKRAFVPLSPDVSSNESPPCLHYAEGDHPQVSSAKRQMMIEKSVISEVSCWGNDSEKEQSVSVNHSCSSGEVRLALELPARENDSGEHQSTPVDHTCSLEVLRQASEGL